MSATASYPDVSLLMKMCAQRKAGRRQRARPAVCTLPMDPCGSSPVTRFALASAMQKTKRMRRRLGLLKVTKRGGCKTDLFLQPENMVVTIIAFFAKEAHLKRTAVYCGKSGLCLSNQIGSKKELTELQNSVYGCQCQLGNMLCTSG